MLLSHLSPYHIPFPTCLLTTFHSQLHWTIVLGIQKPPLSSTPSSICLSSRWWEPSTSCLFCLESSLSPPPLIICCLYLSFTTHFRHPASKEAFLTTLPTNSNHLVVLGDFPMDPHSTLCISQLHTPHTLFNCAYSSASQTRLNSLKPGISYLYLLVSQLICQWLTHI